MEKSLKQLSDEGNSKIIKIALFGPESTGKTSLSKQLASFFNTVWTPEFARYYLQNKWDKNKEICDLEDMLPIAVGQTKLENETLLEANQFLFCDTCLLVTKVFSEAYYQYCDPILDKAAREHDYDLFFLTDIDIPWEKDDLRDRAEGREAVFEIFKQALIDNKKPYIVLSGDQNLRLKKSIFIVNELTLAIKMGFSTEDYLQIYELGMSMETIKKKLKIYKKGIPKFSLISPAKIESGIFRVSNSDFQKNADFFDTYKSKYKLLKFVPASGAASRMFQFLNIFLKEFDIQTESINAYIKRKKDTDLSVFSVGLEKLPFFEIVDAKLKEIYLDFNSFSRDYKNYYFIKLLLNSDFFDFSNKPKGVLPFHKYENHFGTAIEAHLKECVCYSSSNGESNLHFTVSENHQNQFETVVNLIKANVENQSGVKINISYSFQNKSTDAIAVDLLNQPIRNQKGKLIFRPGGHGALLENLNQLDADIIFIKNIDNVSRNHIDSVSKYKKALAGILIEIQSQVFGFLNIMEEGHIRDKDIELILVFIQEQLNVAIAPDFSKYSDDNKLIYLKEILNKPIRICGMVKFEGEPGGGPFWVRNRKGEVSLQIVETAQIDTENLEQASVLAKASLFNPVDLVCGVKDFKGNKFNLKEFVDPKSGFIVEKNSNGIDLKAYELPGLWNGAMAKWISIFVEVPITTFNPVKTVNDLLKSAHQPN